MSGIFSFGFIVVFGIIIYAIVKGISTYINNENSPLIATKARLVDKKVSSHTHTDANGFMTTDETYYLI